MIQYVILFLVYFNVSVSLTFDPHDRQTLATNCVVGAESHRTYHGGSKTTPEDVK